MKKNAFLIAATASRSGKTTLSLGLMRALRRKGLKVQPFKCGPDYIDTQYHCQATGNDSINLDLFMSSELHVKDLFNRYSNQGDVSIVEGVMGMFDGYDNMRGSSADIAHRLRLPVVLIINAASTAFSVAATIYGFTRFRDDVSVVGIIFNRVASENHYKFLLNACEEVGVPALGYLSKNDSLKTPSRHLGLSLDSLSEIENFIEAAANEVERNINIEKLLSLTEIEIENTSADHSLNKNKRIVAVARDEAFNFIYTANIEALRSEIIWFSPLHDNLLPEADMIYLPGGYPELFTDKLETNSNMRHAIKKYAHAGGKILGECGGMIYLTESIDGKKMCGIFPVHTTMNNARLTLGYRQVVFPESELRGHEFHYSHVIDDAGMQSAAYQYNVRGKQLNTPVYRYKNTIAGYTHLYWAETDIFKLWEQ
ncbi:MAG: cobyrinate a,c-diamide synthase [Bacteroides sp.]|nr:cobyrinate a,c-diamide synthase [Bacteroides sp.]